MLRNRLSYHCLIEQKTVKEQALVPLFNETRNQVKEQALIPLFNETKNR